MRDTIKINEIFESIQGEGKYAGTPMLFIRTSGCTRSCDWCDTQYHIKGKKMSLDKLARKIKKTKLEYICWTGGEPLLWRKQIYGLVQGANLIGKKFHLETNGDLLDGRERRYFDYISISPKEYKIAKKVKRIIKLWNKNIYDIKVVTDLEEVGVEMLSIATMLMPLTVYKRVMDLITQREVWDYCIKSNKRFTPRFQIWVWGKKKGI